MYISDTMRETPITYLAANPPERIIVGSNFFDRGNNHGIEFIPPIVFSVMWLKFAT